MSIKLVWAEKQPPTEESWTASIVWCSVQQNTGGNKGKDCNFVLTFSTRVRIWSLLISSLTLNSSRSPSVFSLWISWALWARAALDSMLGGYIENLAITGVREEWLNKNDKRSATNCPQVGLSSWLQLESHWYIAGEGHRVQPGGNCALHYLIWEIPSQPQI